jgi:hypothetical protein
LRLLSFKSTFFFSQLCGCVLLRATWKDLELMTFLAPLKLTLDGLNVLGHVCKSPLLLEQVRSFENRT